MSVSTTKSGKSAVKFDETGTSKSKKTKAKDAEEPPANEEGESPDTARKSEDSKNSLARKGGVLFEEDGAFFKKWSGPLILGPFLPCIVAVIVIVSGQLTLNTWSGTCGYPIDTFVKVAVGICYIFVLLYSWIFLGDNFRLKIQLFDLNVPVLVPFSSLQWLLIIDVVLFFISFIVWCVGSSILSSGYLCAYSAPSLYSYAVFLVAIYWLGFSITMIYLVKLFYGDFLSKIIKEQVRAPTIAELEDRVFRKAYGQFDAEKEGHISRDDVGNLLQVLGVYVPENELPALLSSFDPSESGIVQFEALYDWFKQLNSAADKDVEGGEDDDMTGTK